MEGHSTDKRLGTLAKKLSNEWIPLAINLEQTSAYLDQLKTDYSKNEFRQKLKALVSWRKTCKTQKPLDMKDELVKALKEERRKDLANTLEKDWLEQGTENKPRSEDISQLSTCDPLSEKNLAVLVKKLGVEWFELAINLNLTVSDIEQIESSHPNNVVMQIFVRWKNEYDTHNPSIMMQDLEVALIEVGRIDLANELKQQYQDQTTSVGDLRNVVQPEAGSHSYDAPIAKTQARDNSQSQESQLDMSGFQYFDSKNDQTTQDSAAKTQNKNLSPEVDVTPSDATDSGQRNNHEGSDSVCPSFSIKKNIEVNICPYDGRIIQLDLTEVTRLIDNCGTECIWEEGSGKVFKCPGYKELQMEVVFKKIEYTKENKGQEMAVINEMLAAKFTHYAIVPLLGKVNDPGKDTIYFMYPYIKQCDLYTIINKKKIVEKEPVSDQNDQSAQLNSTDRLRILYQIATAIKYLHTDVPNFRGSIIHCNVTTKNIVIDENKNARLTNFGLSRELEEGRADMPLLDWGGTSGYYETPKEKLTKLTDWYNFGVVILELLYNEPPCEESSFSFDRRRTTFLKNSYKGKMNVWGDWDESKSAKLKDLAETCLALDTTIDPETKLKELLDEDLDIKRIPTGKAMCDICIVNPSEETSSPDERSPLQVDTQLSGDHQQQREGTSKETSSPDEPSLLQAETQLPGDHNQLREVNNFLNRNRPCLEVQAHVNMQHIPWQKYPVVRQCILVWICVKIANKSKDVLRVFPSHRYGQHKNNIVFVVITKKEVDALPNAERYQLVQRSIDSYCDEGIDVTNYIVENKIWFSHEDSAKLRQCLHKHSDRLMKQHSNLTMISACSVKSTNYKENHLDAFTRQCCIVLYVHVKGFIPDNEVAFPKHLDNIPVDVREGRFQFLGPHDYHQRLRMGCQIGINKMWGTLGPFISFQNKTYCLTSAHAVLDNSALRAMSKTGKLNCDLDTGLPMYQPSTEHPDNKFGHIIHAEHQPGGCANAGFEIAVIHVDDRLPDSGKFPDKYREQTGEETELYFSSGQTCHSVSGSGSNVYMYGSTSGFTRGYFSLDGAGIRSDVLKIDDDMCQLEFILHRQIIVHSFEKEKPFAQLGDSGAMVFVAKREDKLNIQALGILEGKAPDGNFIVTPLSDILAAFQHPQMMTFTSSRTEDQIESILEIVKDIQKTLDQRKE